MSKVLEQQTNTLGSTRPPTQKDKTTSNDFIFKRYRYEENTIISKFIVTGLDAKNQKDMKFRDQHEYEHEGKENQLEKYKRKLDEERGIFGVIDFGEGDCEGQDCEPNQESCNDVTQKDITHGNPFQFDEESQTQRNQQQQLQKTNTLSPQKQPLKQNTTQQFEVQPMELVDFEDQDEDEITTTIPAQQNIFHKSHLTEDTSTIHQNHNVYPLITSTSHKSSLTYPKSHVSETFMISPDQSLDGGFGLEESVCNFIEKGKKLKKYRNEPLQKCFSPENIGCEKYQIHKLSENDNPFEDAVEYSNEEEELKGVKIYQSPHEDIKVEIYDKELFVSSKIPPGIILKCKLKRSKGFFSLMNPEFDLYLENGLKHLISARKNLFRNRQLFHLSTEVSNFQKPVRTLMANVLHNTYWLVDAPRVIDKKKISYLDLLIEYQPLDQEGHKERKMTVLCPPALKTYHIGLQYDIPYIDFQWFKKTISLKLYFKGGDVATKVKNSQKNFELVDSEDEEDQIREGRDAEESMSSPNERTGQGLVNGIEKDEDREDKEIYQYLKMYKQSQNVFDVEIQHPLTPLQAMAIILTRFDAQLK